MVEFMLKWKKLVYERKSKKVYAVKVTEGKRMQCNEKMRRNVGR